MRNLVSQHPSFIHPEVPEFLFFQRNWRRGREILSNAAFVVFGLWYYGIRVIMIARCYIGQLGDLGCETSVGPKFRLFLENDAQMSDGNGLGGPWVVAVGNRQERTNQQHQADGHDEQQPFDSPRHNCSSI